MTAPVDPKKVHLFTNELKIQAARMKRARLASESAKLDPSLEKDLAEEGLGQEFESWPEY